MKTRASAWSYRELIVFSLPSLAASLLEPLASLVDTLLVGRISTQWLAALAVASAIFNTITWAFNFLIHTSVQSVSSEEAKGNHSALWARIKMASFASTLLGLASLALLWWGRDLWFALASGDPAYQEEWEAYFLVRALSQPFVLLGLTWLSIVRGFSLVRETFFILMVSTLSNIALSALFLYEFELGIAGAAYGTLLAQLFVFASCVALVIKKRPGAVEAFRAAPLTRAQWGSFGRDSLGMLIRSGSLSLTFFLSTKFAGRAGIYHLAAHQILLQLWLLSSFFIDGLAVSANILAARYYAKRDAASLRFIARRLVLLSVAVGLLFSSGYFFFDEQILGLFSRDGKLIAQAREIFPLVALSQGVVSIAYLYDGLLFGVGKFLILGVIMLVGLLAVVAPALFWAAQTPGLTAIWWGLVLLGCYRALAGHLFYQRILRGL